MIKDKDIDKLFREKLENYEQQPPAYLLENILTAAAGARRKRKIVFWRVAAVAAALLLAFVAGWQVNYMNHEGINQPVVISQNTIPQAKESKKAVPEKDTASPKIQKSKTAKGNRDTQVTTGNRSPVGTTTRNDSERNRDTRVAAADATLQGITSKKNEEAQLSTPLKPDDKNTLSETMAVAPTVEPTLPNSAKTTTPLNHSMDQIENTLTEKKEGHPNNESPELTIDEQIIAQNKAQLQAQNEKRKDAHWLVGAQVSPAYSVNRSNHSAQYASNMLSSSSNTPIAMGGGLTVQYKKGKRWSLQSGIYYAGLGQSTGNSSLSNKNQYTLTGKGSEYFNAPVDVKSNNMLMNSTAGVIEFNGIPKGIELGTNLEDKTLATAVVVSDARFIQNFQYLEIPLYLRYTVLDARFDIELMGGFSSNVLIGNDTYLQDSNGKSLVGKTQDMQGLNYSGTMGLGLKYGLSRRIYLNLEPRIKYFLNSLNTNAAVNYKPYTIGVYTGISYQF